MQVLQDIETARKVFTSLGVTVKQGKSFLFLTQFTGFPGACLETISAKAYLPQEYFSCSGKTGQAIIGRSCHHAEGTSGSSEPYGTLHFCSPSCKAVHASLRMSDSRNRPSQQGCDYFFLLLPLWFWLDALGTPASAKGHGCVYLSTLEDNYWCFSIWTGTSPKQSNSPIDSAFC